jgi:hypothetical protein
MVPGILQGVLSTQKQGKISSPKSALQNQPSELACLFLSPLMGAWVRLGRVPPASSNFRSAGLVQDWQAVMPDKRLGRQASRRGVTARSVDHAILRLASAGHPDWLLVWAGPVFIEC